MAEYGNIRTGRHRAFALHTHLVFVTKYPHKVFRDVHLRRMEEIMRAVCEDFETELVAFKLKGVSSRRLRQEFPDLVPQIAAVGVLPPGQRFRGRAVEDLTEVPGLDGGLVTCSVLTYEASGIISRDDPRAVYVLGQPGAGKLLAPRMVRARCGGWSSCERC
ncbi:hypothetical protein SRB17_83420 [Streptomyces sp. RB17]|nr:hypothetical protein [Streptomyces sp. RB17]